MKTRFRLCDTGRVVVRMAPEGLKREKRRIRKHVAMLEEGLLDGEAVRRSYLSWRGSVLAATSGRYLARQMDRYFEGALMDGRLA